MKRGLFVHILAILSILGFSLPAGAEFPERPITLIVIFSAGGGADLSARALSKKAEKVLGQPIMVVNKTGAGGTIGVAAIAAARPDGYTIGTMSLGAATMAPHMFDVSYDPLRGFDYIMGYGEYLFGLVVRGDSPFKTLKDLVQFAKANPGKIKYSTTGVATTNNFAMVKLGRAEGIQWDLVTFKGAPESVAACLGGHVDIVSQNPGDVEPYIKAGRLRLLASFSAQRWEWVPDVPTVRELGYNFDITNRLGLCAPKGVPKPVMDKLRDAFKKALDDPEFQEIMKKIYLPVADHRTPEQYQELVEADYKENEAMIRGVGMHKSQQKK